MLRGADLSWSNLSATNFEFTDLQGVKLIECDLTGAKLRGANLKGAILQDANLADADLIGTLNLEIDQICMSKNYFLAELPKDLKKKVLKSVECTYYLK